MKKMIIICVAIVVIASSALIIVRIKTRINLPNIEMVALIELEYFDIIDGMRKSICFVAIENQNDIDTILSVLSEARLVNRWGALNDSPLIWSSYLSVFIYSDEHLMERLFLYTTESRGYVFASYRGLYRIDQNIILKIHQMMYVVN